LKILLIPVIAILLLSILSTVPVSFADKKYDSLVYSPIRPNSSAFSQGPSYDQIKNDMEILSQYTDSIFLYDSMYATSDVLSIAEKYDMKVTILVDLERNAEKNNILIDNVINSANRHVTVDHIVIGSNEIYNETTDISKLRDIIEMVKSRTNVKVSSLNNAGIWLDEKNHILADVVDVIYYDNFEFLNGGTPSDAVTRTTEIMKTMKKVFPDKESIVMVGWPTDGNEQASVDNQVEFTNMLLEKSTDNVLFFEAFDEAWKAYNSDRTEAYWGFIDADRNIKENLVETHIEFPTTSEIVDTAITISVVGATSGIIASTKHGLFEGIVTIIKSGMIDNIVTSNAAVVQGVFTPNVDVISHHKVEYFVDIS